jgi:hypothetical protein
MELNGVYVVRFKDPSCPKDVDYYKSFVGKCENFNPSGKCAFSNENNEMLIVDYKDISQMRLTTS